MAIWNVKIIKVMIAFKFAVGMLSGLIPYTYSFKQTRFVASKLSFIYALLLSIGFSIFYGRSILDDYLNNVLHLQDAIKLSSYVNILVSIVCYIADMIHSNAALEFLQKNLLFETVKYLGVREQVVQAGVLLISVKFLAFPLIIQLVLMLRQQHDEPEGIAFFATLFIFTPYIVANIQPNFFFGALTVCKLLILSLNEHLMEIVKELNCMQSTLQMQLQKPFYRMQRFCDLSDTLDTLSAKFAIISVQRGEYVDLMGVPLICSLLSILLGITSGLYTQYHDIADSLINEDPYDAFNAATNAILLIILVTDLIMMANICNDNCIVVEQTGIILQSINLQHADVRFKQSVECFSLLVFNSKSKVKPLGLLDVDISLLHAVLSTVTSFLLILIQSDLTQRFSLK